MLYIHVLYIYIYMLYIYTHVIYIYMLYIYIRYIYIYHICRDWDTIAVSSKISISVKVYAVEIRYI